MNPTSAAAAGAIFQLILSLAVFVLGLSVIFGAPIGASRMVRGLGALVGSVLAVVLRGLIVLAILAVIYSLFRQQILKLADHFAPMPVLVEHRSP
jgi:hypothetical protein